MSVKAHSVSGDPNSGDPNSGDPVSGDPVSGDPVSGDLNSGDPVSGDPVSGDLNSGDPVSGDSGYVHTAGKWGPNPIFFFCSHVTQICFCHDSVNSTNHMESDLFNSNLCHFICGTKSDTGQLFCNAIAVWKVMLDFMRLLHHSRSTFVTIPRWRETLQRFYMPKAIKTIVKDNQWKCDVLELGLHDILHAIVMRISSVKPVLWLALNLHHLLSSGAAFNTQSRSSLTSYAIRAQNRRWIACDIECDIA